MKAALFLFLVAPIFANSTIARAQTLPIPAPAPAPDVVQPPAVDLVENGFARCRPHMRRDPSRIVGKMTKAEVEKVPFVYDEGFEGCAKIHDAWKSKRAAQNSQSEKDAIAAIAAKIGN